jgi:DUF1365 family protein
MAISGDPSLAPLLFFGRVMHARLRPRRNIFSYRVFFVRMAVQALDKAGGPLFSLDRFNLFSVHRRDYGPRDGSSLESWIRNLLQREGITTADGAIWLQTFPRVLGYVFNPVSFWLCLDNSNQLRAALCEVNNTFGEHHTYLISHPDQRPILPTDSLRAAKVFHVSPFCEVKGQYRFSFEPDAKRALFRIDYDDEDGMLLLTSVSGAAQPLGTRSLLWAFFAYPLMTLGVIARIHWQALRLWMKRVPFFSKPVPPVERVTR